MTTEYVPHARSTQQQPVTAQVDLSFDEVANLFPFPIAEAASTLGVSTNDLKRVCRENGLNRWPYRKILAGKSVEDVKKEAAREMAIMERMARLQPQSTPNAPNALRSNRPGAYNFNAGSVPTEIDRATIDLTKRQQPVGPAHGLYVHASSLKPLQIDQRLQLPNQFHLRINIPTYLDEFRQGFPSKGLSSVSAQWWGTTALSSSTENLDDDKKNEDGDGELSPSHLEDESRKCGIEDDEGEGRKDEGTSSREVKRLKPSVKDPMPASMLTRTREYAVDMGRKALGIAVTRGYGAYRLADKDEALLRAIFAENFPSLWEASTGVNQHAQKGSNGFLP